MTQKFSDNARALLTGSVTDADTTLTIEAGKADRFPIADTASWGTVSDWFKMVLIDSAGNREVVYVGVRAAGDNVLGNLQRGQEGTEALAFAAGSVAILAITAADVEEALSGDFETLVASESLDVNGPMRQNGLEGRFTPVGGIIMWSGSIASVPAGWALCDGTLGTPNLRDRFIVGAGSTYAPSAIGGTADAIVTAHSHTVAITTSGQTADHTHAVSDPGHAHAYTKVGAGAHQVDGADVASLLYQLDTGATTSAAATGIALYGASSDHAHYVNGTTASAGSNGVGANVPPYFALAYIMCLAEA